MEIKVVRRGLLARAVHDPDVAPVELASDLMSAMFSSAGTAGAIRAGLRPSRHNDLTAIRCPVLVLSGIEDRLIAAGDSAELVRQMPHARREMWSSVGRHPCGSDPTHSPSFCRPSSATRKARLVTLDRISALRSIREDVLSYCSDLDHRQWMAESRASGWRVKDVVAHLGASCRVLASPKALGVLRSEDSEADNDIFVDERRTWPAVEVLAEFERWSKIVIVVMSLASRGPFGKVRVQFGNLGSYPIWTLPSTLVFDWHTHLHHDIVPVIGKPASVVTRQQLEATVEWMLAGLEQMNRRDMGWVDRSLRLELTGDGGGCWHIAPAGDGLLTVSPKGGSEAAAQITGATADFPVWATTRMHWRDAKLTITGDRAYAARFLDTVNII